MKCDAKIYDLMTETCASTDRMLLLYFTAAMAVGLSRDLELTNHFHSTSLYHLLITDGAFSLHLTISAKSHQMNGP